MWFGRRRLVGGIFDYFEDYGTSKSQAGGGGVLATQTIFGNYFWQQMVIFVKCLAHWTTNRDFACA